MRASSAESTLKPTSTTTAPGFTQCPCTKPGLPAATISTSANAQAFSSRNDSALSSCAIVGDGRGGGGKDDDDDDDSGCESLAGTLLLELELV